MAHLFWLADDVVINLDTVVAFQIRDNQEALSIQVITLSPKIEYRVDGVEAVTLRAFLEAQRTTEGQR